MSASPAAAVAPAQAEEPSYAWVVVWATFVSLAVIFGVSYSFAAFFESFAGAFNAQRADVSLVFGLSGGVYFVFGVGGGMLADRFGPRVVTSSGMLLHRRRAAVVQLRQLDVHGLRRLRCRRGLGIALVYTPSIGCVQPWFSQRRGLAAGLASAGIGAGTVAVPLIATALIAALQWRDALRVLAAGVLVLGLCATWLLKRAPVPTSSAGGRASGLSLAEALRSRHFWWLYVGVLASPSMFIPFAHVSAAARDLGIGEARAVGLVGIIGIGSLVGRFVIGALADRFGRALTLTLMRLRPGCPTCCGAPRAATRRWRCSRCGSA